MVSTPSPHLPLPLLDELGLQHAGSQHYLATTLSNNGWHSYPCEKSVSLAVLLSGSSNDGRKGGGAEWMSSGINRQRRGMSFWGTPSKAQVPPQRFPRSRLVDCPKADPTSGIRKWSRGLFFLLCLPCLFPGGGSPFLGRSAGFGQTTRWLPGKRPQQEIYHV